MRSQGHSFLSVNRSSLLGAGAVREAPEIQALRDIGKEVSTIAMVYSLTNSIKLIGGFFCIRCGHECHLQCRLGASTVAEDRHPRRRTGRRSSHRWREQNFFAVGMPRTETTRRSTITDGIAADATIRPARADVSALGMTAARHDANTFSTPPQRTMRTRSHRSTAMILQHCGHRRHCVRRHVTNLKGCRVHAQTSPLDVFAERFRLCFAKVITDGTRICP